MTYTLNREGLISLDRAAMLAALILPNILFPVIASGQVSTTLNGAPAQVTPYATEVGVPATIIPQGVATTADPTGAAPSGANTSSNSDSDALDTMLAQSWGNTATANAEALGLNPSALAATCVIESGCGTDLGDGSGAEGIFQMYPAAFQEGLETALAADPSLASEVVQGSTGINDPNTEAIAASGYLMEADQNLLSAGISDPTVIDARGYYNFGPSYGAQLAEADQSEPMANVLNGMSQSVLAANGISAGETVGQWQSSEAAKIGNAANQSILS